MDIAKLYKTQISFTEWLEEIGHVDTEAMRKEDNEKRQRLAQVDSKVGLPYEKATRFEAMDVLNKTEEFVEFLDKKGNELCALRLVPKRADLPKFRLRGDSIRDVYTQWFPTQKIEHTEYYADFVPHPTSTEWATIFIVNEHGVFGEVIKGGHHQLTQGFYEENTPMPFSFDFTAWDAPEECLEHLKEVVAHLHMNEEKQQTLTEMNVDFSHGYMHGYFETVKSPEFGTWFLDFNRVLGKMLGDLRIGKQLNGELTGHIGYAGMAQGKVRVVTSPTDAFEEGDILVCKMTTPAFLPLMKKASAIVTELGGVLTHAAIVAREMQIPCVVGVKDVTSALQDGDVVEVKEGKVTIVSNTK